MERIRHTSFGRKNSRNGLEGMPSSGAVSANGGNRARNKI